MLMTLQREVLSDESTIGQLRSEDGEFVCFTLEDKVRPEGVKLFGKTAIPASRYRIEITESQRFKKRLPILLNVNGYEGVRIHAGNTSADTEGCILVGLTKDKDFIGKSQMALSLLMPKLEAALQDGGEVWITIKNPKE